MSGYRLNLLWGVNARHALYREDGRWYHHLERFPGALFDSTGFVVFPTEAAYHGSPYLRRGVEVNVPGGISNMPGYVRVCT